MGRVAAGEAPHVIHPVGRERPSAILQPDIIPPHHAELRCFTTWQLGSSALFPKQVAQNEAEAKPLQRMKNMEES